MPRPVVPMAPFPEARSRMTSSSWCSGRIKVTFSAIRNESGETATPCPWRRAISSSSAFGSSTTPLPMTDNLPCRTTPEGSSDNL